MVAVSAAWPLAVSLWPAGSRPYIGGSTNGSVWDLIFGYNGFGRLTGAENGWAGAAGAAAASAALPACGGCSTSRSAARSPGCCRSPRSRLVAGLWLTRRAPRTDLRRAGLVLFGVWAIVHVAVFSSQQGIFHPYYVSALAPAVAALTGFGVVALTRLGARPRGSASRSRAAAVAATAWVAVTLLGRTPDFAPWLRVAIPVAAAIAVAGLVALRAGLRTRAVLAVAARDGRARARRRPRRLQRRDRRPVADLQQRARRTGERRRRVRRRLGWLRRIVVRFRWAGRRAHVGAGQSRPGRRRPAPASSRHRPLRWRPVAGRAARRSSASLLRYLEAHQGSAKYLVAASGSMTTAPIIIQTGKAVVTIGGFNGADPAPTVTQLAKMVADGELRYVLLSSDGGFGGGGPGGNGSSSALTRG